MTTREIKEQINSVIDTIPDDVLDDVLEYLKTVKGMSRSKVHMSHNLSKIPEEDRNLLERLAR